MVPLSASLLAHAVSANPTSQSIETSADLATNEVYRRTDLHCKAGGALLFNHERFRVIAEVKEVDSYMLECSRPCGLGQCGTEMLEIYIHCAKSCAQVAATCLYLLRMCSKNESNNVYP